jgi:hypothetical protein
VCIFVRKDQSFKKIHTSLHCAEQALGVCAIELETESSDLRILGLYRASSTNFIQFIEGLDASLKYFCNPKSEFLICGDINVDYPGDDKWKKQLNSLLTTYNLFYTLHLATRTQNDSSTTIDNIFVDITRLSLSSTCPTINGLSDHNAQFLTVNNTAPATNIVPLRQRTREINNERIMQFQLQLANESWESVYTDDTNNKFNYFLCTFLNNSEASFPVKYIAHRNKNG